jgi:hypothetical protein
MFKYVFFLREKIQKYFRERYSEYIYIYINTIENEDCEPLFWRFYVIFITHESYPSLNAIICRAWNTVQPKSVWVWLASDPTFPSNHVWVWLAWDLACSGLGTLPSPRVVELDTLLSPHLGHAHFLDVPNKGESKEFFRPVKNKFIHISILLVDTYKGAQQVSNN